MENDEYSHIIQLPSRVDHQSLLWVIGQAIDSEKKPLFSSCTIDFSKVRFITPTGVVALANVTDVLFRHHVDLGFKLPSHVDPFSGVLRPARRECPVDFLDDCGFFELYFGQRLRAGSCTSRTAISVRRLYPEQSADWMLNVVIPWLDASLGFEVEKRFPELNMCVTEIMNNARDHSGDDIACAFFQHYPKKHTVEFAISDFGIGIPNKVRTQEPRHVQDHLAILRATEEGFSTKSTPRNRGAGLDILVNLVVGNNGGELLIASLNGFAHFTQGPDGAIVRASDDNSSHPYPGTLLSVTLKTDTLPEEDLTEEVFEWNKL